MLIKNLNFKDYKIIKKLIKKNYSKLPTLDSLKLLDKISKKKIMF